MKTIAIILAGGTGQRFKSSIPKQYINLNGHPIIEYSYQTFLKHPKITSIIIASHPDWIQETQKICPKALVIKGGKTRTESAKNALQACPDDTDFVLLHDANRPFVSNDIIDRCITALENGHVAVDTIIPSADTMLIVENNIIKEMPDRNKMRRGQTPQAMLYKEIRKAYGNIDSDIIPTDDIRIAFNNGIECFCVNGSEYNIKITEIVDIYKAERIAQLVNEVSPTEINLENKKCLVFGADGGIGSAIVTMLREHKAQVLEFSYPNIDFRCPEHYWHYFFYGLKYDKGSIDIIINAVGVLNRANLVNTGTHIENDIKINFIAPIYMTKYALADKILNPGGAIFHIGSSSWSQGRASYSVYSASKAALVNFVQAVAEEHPEYRINCINPPRTNTPMRRKAFPDEDPQTLLDPQVVAMEILKYINTDKTGCVIDLKIGM